MNPTIVISTRIGTTVVNDYQTTGGGTPAGNGMLFEDGDVMLFEDGDIMLYE